MYRRFALRAMLSVMNIFAKQYDKTVPHTNQRYERRWITTMLATKLTTSSTIRLHECFLFSGWMVQNIWQIKVSNMTVSGVCGQTSWRSASSLSSSWSLPTCNCDKWRSWNKQNAITVTRSLLICFCGDYMCTSCTLHQLVFPVHFSTC